MRKVVIRIMQIMAELRYEVTLFMGVMSITYMVTHYPTAMKGLLIKIPE